MQYQQRYIHTLDTYCTVNQFANTKHMNESLLINPDDLIEDNGGLLDDEDPYQLVANHSSTITKTRGIGNAEFDQFLHIIAWGQQYLYLYVYSECLYFLVCYNPTQHKKHTRHNHTLATSQLLSCISRQVHSHLQVNSINFRKSQAL